jgi:hypothetical protein
MAALFAVVVAAAAPPARAADPGTGVLSSADGSVTWSGGFADVLLGVTDPVFCVLGVCDEFALHVALPDDTWTLPGDGVQISIEWPDEANDLDLFVYAPDGSLAARSDGAFGSEGESVRIPRAGNGDYRVVVVPRLVSGAMSYEGLAEVERQVAVEPVRDLLPNLVPVAPTNLHFATGAYLFDPGFSPFGTCYPEETIEQGAQRCLRFDQVIANRGDGPFELRYKLEGLATDQRLDQRIYSSDGSYRDRKADTYQFHPAHAHFHYRNFAQSRLWASEADGNRLGDAPVRVTRKNGFCMIDVRNERFGPGEKGEAPRGYMFPACNTPTSGTDMRNGISVGWADVYNWFLADQFIEVSGLAPGHYVLETITDPGNTIREITTADNLAASLIRLTEDGAEEVRTL